MVPRKGRAYEKGETLGTPMRVIKVSRNRLSRRVLDEVAAVLAAGGTVVMPTETAYGIAADPHSAKAVAAVYLAKGRPRRKPLPLIAASVADVRATFDLRGPVSALARRHWPGPLTLVLPLKSGIRLPATAGERDGAVRVPKSAWARAIAAAAGGLVTSTSANVSGDATIYDPRDVVRSFRHRRHAPTLLLDAGPLPVRKPSTIVRLKRGMMEVLRQGSVKVRE